MEVVTMVTFLSYILATVPRNSIALCAVMVIDPAEFTQRFKPDHTKWATQIVLDRNIRNQSKKSSIDETEDHTFSEEIS
uniref:Secreted protein n=1 Tax=Solanum lycopersicum TaxID=4081 RepID=A0A3Q7EPD2_SOLLC